MSQRYRNYKLICNFTLLIFSIMRKLYFITFILYFVSSSIATAESAKFTYFKYQGYDSLYNADKLTNSGDFFNPIISGWSSDPSLVRVGNDYWLVTSTFGFFPGVPLYHSTDLVNWTHASNILSRPSQLPWLEGESLGKGGIYAPAISYNPHNKLFYMITTCVTKKGSINFYVTATDPMGEWSEPVLLPDVKGIDPSFFFDDDGKAYIVHKADEHSPVKWSNNRALAIIEFDYKTGKTIGDPIKFREIGVGPEEKLERDEGPHIYKINGKYYLIAAEGGTGMFHSEMCYKSDSPLGPWQRWSRNPMLSQRLAKPNRPLPITSTGHAELFNTPDGNWYAVFLGCRPWINGNEQLGRETFLMPVRWSQDSFPYITQNLDLVPIVQNMPGTTQKTLQTGNIKFATRFNHPLDNGWISLWGSADKYIKMGGDGLRLTFAPVDASSGITPAFIGRRIQNQEFMVETTVQIPKGATADDAAGLLVVKNEKRQIFFAVFPDGIKVIKPNDKTLSSVNIDMSGKAVTLRLTCSDGKYYFAYSSGGNDTYVTIPVSIDVAYVSSSAGGFTGSVVGIFATSANRYRGL